MPHVSVHVTGIVQGVGYRPFVWQQATRLGLAGWVRNASDGVHIEAKGTQEALDAFVMALSTQKPGAARVDGIHVDRLGDDHISPAAPARSGQVSGLVPGSDFRIVESDADTDLTTLVSPDIATCPTCLRELADKGDRRYHYPFINCTNCGPRFTVIDELPYDRRHTSMAGFEMCPDCAREYADPTDRRFHAQPDACFACGPQLSWRTSAKPGYVRWGDNLVSSDTIITAAARMLREGGIVAVKGLGGYHLACDATNEEAVQKLRQRKHRPSKPLAVMFARFEDLRRAAEVGVVERQQLTGTQRPIVLVLRKPEAEVPEGLRVARSVAGDLPELGVMLPYTPLQHLLLQACGFPLVMTSGNISDEPIVTDDQIAVARLMDVADGWLGNNRPIRARYDDSVVRVVGDRVMPVRRARGIAPTPVRCPQPPAARDAGLTLPNVLACGPEQKATFCIARGGDAFVSQHVGDLENAESFDVWQDDLAQYADLFGLRWDVLACDLHPEYLSSKWAREEARKTGKPLVEVQHHHAHIAAVLAEEGVWDEVVGVALDGTGYGTDGAIWGCEIMTCDQASFARAAHLAYWRLPGGAAAIKKPQRCALGLLEGCGLSAHPMAQKLVESMGIEGPVVSQMMQRDLNCPRTSSAGRLFDAVAAILGLVREAGYDGEPACLLEAAARRAPEPVNPNDEELALVRYAMELRHAVEGEALDPDDTSLVMDPSPLVKAVLDDLDAGVDPRIIARRFHNGFAEGVARAAIGVARAAGLDTVALGGGVLCNRLLFVKLSRTVFEAGMNVLVGRDLPVNDGCISYGQAAVARARMAAGLVPGDTAGERPQDGPADGGPAVGQASGSSAGGAGNSADSPQQTS